METIDSAGMRIVRIGDLDRLSFAAWSTRLLFTTQGHDSLPIAPTVQAGFTPDSSLWITGHSEVFVFDRHGIFRRQVGRNGDGPGEFRGVFHLGILDDGSVIVSDLGAGRVTRFDAGGEPIRSIRRLSIDGSFELDVVTQLGDGRILATYWQHRPNRTTGFLREGAVTRDSAPLVVLDSTGRPLERLGLWPGRERARLDLQGEPAALPLPFGRTTVYDGRNGRAVIGPTDSLDFTMFEHDRPVLRLLAPPIKGRHDARLTDVWARAIRQEAPDVADVYLGAMQCMPKPATPPAVGAVVIDDAGNVWIADYAVQQGAMRTWHSVSRRGEPLGRIELPTLAPLLLPGSPELLDVFGDRIAVRRQTTAGETIVEVHVLVKP